jgi:hypothetical protein
MASFRPVLVRASLMRSAYLRSSRNFSGSAVTLGSAMSYQTSLSKIDFSRATAHVIVRAGNDELVALDVLVEHELPGIGAFDPQILRRLAAQDVADFRPDDVGEPIHVSLRAIKESRFAIYGGPGHARQAAPRCVARNCGLFRSLFGLTHALRQ